MKMKKKKKMWFQGSLYVLSGPKQMPMIARFDWKILELWIALVRAKPSEKLSVVKLIENLMKSVHKHFSLMSVDLRVPDDCLEKAKIVLKSVTESPDAIVTPENIQVGKIKLEEKCDRNRKCYYDVLNSFYETIQKNNLYVVVIH